MTGLVDNPANGSLVAWLIGTCVHRRAHKPGNAPPVDRS
jgi:hypothetical protein